MKNNPILNVSYQKKRENDFQKEVSNWNQKLNWRMEENVLQKNRLSDILKYNYHQYLLEEIEEFQTHFINQDEITHLLRRRVKDLNSESLNKDFEEHKGDKSFITLMNNLRDNIQHSGNRFRLLVSHFANFQDKNGWKPEN